MKIAKKIGGVFLFSILISFFCVSLLGKKVNPILLNYLNLEVERITSNVIDSTVNDVLAQGLTQELFIVSKNTNNEIEMIDYNSQEVNALLYDINQKVYLKLKKCFLLVWILPLEKCSRCRVYFSDFIDIYMSYIKIL